MSKPHKNYTILESKPLGVGGQAEVFRARDKRSDAVVAFKRIKPNLRSDKDVIARMRREIEVQTAIKHQNVMPIFDHSDSFYWYTMPIAEKVVAALPTPVNDEMLIQIVEDCAHGLIVAHENGYVHRDITPNNILLISENDELRWVVADWGLVRRHGQTTSVYTAPGQRFGTAGFSAPETWFDAHNVDKCADVYGLGRVVAWCLTGKWPSPNIPLLPEGKWLEFVTLTTNLDSAQRIQDMNGILELVAKIKTPGKESTTTNGEIKSLAGLTNIDTSIFKAICDASIDAGIDWVNINQIAVIIEELGISEDDLTESIDIMADNLYIKGTRDLNGRLEYFQITTFGFEQYAAIFLPEFENIRIQTLLTITNNGIKGNKAIANHLNLSLVLVEYAIDSLARQNLIKITKTFGGMVSIDEVTAQGRRAARGLQAQ